MAIQKGPHIIPVIVILSFLALSTWQLGIFSMGGSTSTTSSGFSKIKPILAATILQPDGRFNGEFTNGVGVSIYINSVKITETNYGKTCYGAINPKNVSPGGSFVVTSDGCIKGYLGDVYTLNIEIGYDANISGIKSTKTEIGTIRGAIEGYTRGGYDYSYKYYGIHKSFDFGEWWIVVILLSIVLIMEAYNRLNRVSDLTSIHIVGLYSFMFILCSTFIFIFGLDSFFNTTTSRYDVSLQLKYGWLIESVIYFIVGLILIIVTEYFIQKEDKSKTAIPSILLPIVTLLVLSIVFIYPYRIIKMGDRLTPKIELWELSWIIEILIFVIIAIAYILIIKKISEHKGKYELPGALYYTDKIALLYFMGSAIFLITFVHTLVYSSIFDFKSILNLVLIGFGGLVLLKISRPISKT